MFHPPALSEFVLLLVFVFECARLLYPLHFGRTDGKICLGDLLSCLIFFCEQVTFTVWDVGGQDKIRPLWRHYFANTQGLIYVVDSNDRDRIPEAREELSKMVGEEELRNATVLVFANKQDLPNAMPVADLTQELGLPNMTNRKWFVQACCATNATGLYEGLDWLTENLAE